MKESLKNTKEQLLRQLFDEHYKRLLGLSFKMVRDLNVAEDIVQEVFVSIWEKNFLDDINTDGYTAYLSRAVYNRSISYLRTLAKRNQSSSDVQYSNISSTSNAGLECQDIDKLLEKTLMKLPAQSRAVFLLSRFSDKSYAEIADELQLSIKTVEYHMSKVLKRLRATFRKHGFFQLFLFFFTKKTRVI